MDAKEILHSIFRMFFVIYMGAAMAMFGTVTVLALVFSVEPQTHYFLSTFIYLSIASVGTSLTQFVFYSRSEMNSRQMYLRYFIQWALVVGIMLLISRLAEWVLVWHGFFTLSVFVFAVTMVFAAVHVIEAIQIKMIVDGLNKELKKRDIS